MMDEHEYRNVIRVNLSKIRSLLVDFVFSSRRRHTRLQGDWSSDVCSSDLKYFFHILAIARNSSHHAVKKLCAFVFRLCGVKRRPALEFDLKCHVGIVEVFRTEVDRKSVV